MTETWLERNWNRLKKVVATLHPGHKLARQPLPHVPDEVLRIPITCQHCSNQTNKHKNTTPVWNLPQRWRSHTRPVGQPEEVHVFLHEPAARFHSLILLGLDHSSPRRWIQIQPTQVCRVGGASWWILNLSSLICPHSDTHPRTRPSFLIHSDPGQFAVSSRQIIPGITVKLKIASLLRDAAIWGAIKTGELF